MMTETPGLVGQTLGQGRYQVKRKLGEGGMAFVLLAFDNNVGIDVVLKVPKPDILADPGFAHRFKREVRSMVELTHPHIVKIKDVGEHEGLPFYVMDLLTGGSLEDRFETNPDKTKKPMSPASLATWLEPVARALDFIHLRYVHRDIKPANILFDSYGNPFVSDFGIVKTISDSAEQKKQTVMTQAGMVIGTGPYMAPEITEGKKYDGRADQYALAATVYEVLSGRVPFDGTTLHAIIVQQMTGSMPPLHQLVPTLPRPLTKVVEKGLGRDPASRYANCAAFAKAVLAAFEGTAATATLPAGQGKTSPTVHCAACKNPFTLPPDPAGKSIRCPACGAIFTVTKRQPEPLAAETRPSALARAATQVGQRQDNASHATQSIVAALPLTSRRLWIGIVLAVVLAVLGLAVVGVVAALFLWGGSGKKGDRAKVLGN